MSTQCFLSPFFTLYPILSRKYKNSSLKRHYFPLIYYEPLIYDLSPLFPQMSLQYEDFHKGANFWEFLPQERSKEEGSEYETIGPSVSSTEISSKEVMWLFM